MNACRITQPRAARSRCTRARVAPHRPVAHRDGRPSARAAAAASVPLNARAATDRSSPHLGRILFERAYLDLTDGGQIHWIKPRRRLSQPDARLQPACTGSSSAARPKASVEKGLVPARDRRKRFARYIVRRRCGREFLNHRGSVRGATGVRRSSSHRRRGKELVRGEGLEPPTPCL